MPQKEAASEEAAQFREETSCDVHRTIAERCLTYIQVITTNNSELPKLFREVASGQNDLHLYPSLVVTPTRSRSATMSSVPATTLGASSVSERTKQESEARVRSSRVFRSPPVAPVVHYENVLRVRAMSYAAACCPPFTLEQVTSLATWNLVRPAGLGARIARDHACLPEVAALFRHDPEDVRYLMNPTHGGAVVLVRSSGGTWALPSIETALAKVLALESGGSGGARADTPRLSVGATRPAGP